MVSGRGGKKKRERVRRRGKIQSSEKRMAQRSILEGNNEKEKYA